MRWDSCISIAFALLVATPALADDYDSSLGNFMAAADKTDRTTISLDATQAVAVYASAVCALDRDQGAKLILRQLPESKFDRRSLFSIAYFSGTCGEPGEARRLMPFFGRGVTAELLFKRDFFPGRKGSGGVQIFGPPSDAERAKLSTQTRAALEYIAFGECVSKAAPGQIVQLLSTQVASAEEKAAFGGLREAMRACVSPTLQLRMSALLLRGFLAEGAYRNAVAQIGRN